MSLKITELCVNCDVCEPVCPNQAISLGAEIYEIAPNRCTECVGHYDVPQCVEVCPVECIVADPQHPESRVQLLAKFDLLTGKGVPETRGRGQPPSALATKDDRKGVS